MKKSLFSFSVLLFLLSSCEEKKAFDLYSPEFKKMMESSDGFFRNLEPGMTIEQVKLEEKWSLRDEEKDYLFFEQREKSGEMQTLECLFGVQGLTEIKLDSYFIGSAEARSLFNEMKEYYKSRFGESEDYYGFSGWITEFDDKAIHIELTDESSEYRQGKIGLFIYEYIPEAPKKPGAL